MLTSKEYLKLREKRTKNIQHIVEQLAKHHDWERFAKDPYRKYPLIYKNTKIGTYGIKDNQISEKVRIEERAYLDNGRIWLDYAPFSDWLVYQNKRIVFYSHCTSSHYYHHIYKFIPGKWEEILMDKFKEIFQS